LGLLVAEVRADQVGIVDPAVVDVLAGLHLRLELLDDVAFLDQVVRQLDAGDLAEGLGQRLRFVFMRGDRLRDDLDLHAGEGLRGIDEPLHLLLLLLLGERRGSGTRLSIHFRAPPSGPAKAGPAASVSANSRLAPERLVRVIRC
jgi:hypothetical protein